jgi:uncharacterized protein YceK
MIAVSGRKTALSAAYGAETAIMVVRVGRRHAAGVRAAAMIARNGTSTPLTRVDVPFSAIMTTLGTTRHVAGPAAVANSHDVLSLRQAHEVAHEAEHRLRHAAPRLAAATVHAYPR